MDYIIIEDEQRNADLLHRLVNELRGDSHLLAVLPSVQDSVEWLKSNKVPELIFMDIRLADGLSFDIFNQFDIESPVIFTTAYDEYALQAFKVYGAAYLLKPILKDELEEALAKVERLKVTFSTEDVNSMLQILKTNKNTYKSRFLLHYRETYRTISVNTIDYIYLENKLVYFSLKDSSLLVVPYTLEELEEQLDPQFFFRVNRQYILHIDSIDSIHKYFNEKAKIILKNDKTAEVIVSRVKMPTFKLWLDY